MNEPKDEKEIEALVEAQAAGEAAAEGEVEAASEGELDEWKSKGGINGLAFGACATN